MLQNFQINSFYHLLNHFPYRHIVAKSKDLIAKRELQKMVKNQIFGINYSISKIPKQEIFIKLRNFQINNFNKSLINIIISFKHIIIYIIN